MKKQWLSFVCVIALALGLMVIPTQAAESPVTMKAQGWYETICAELTGVADADVAAVSYIDAEGTETALEGEDFTFLVRDMAGGVRVDIPGVKAGTYDLSVKLTDGRGYVALGLEVKAYDRSGFAHKVHTKDDSGAITGIVDYTEGVGAYNDDGTLKENATVLYVTDANKDTVTLTEGSDSLSGIGNILNTAGYKTNGPNGGQAPKILLTMSRADKPLVIRIVGEVNAPKGVSPFVSGSSNGSMCYMKYAKNVTIEGIGPDATIHGWGFSFSGDASDANNDLYGKNFEVRNLSFREVPEDCVEITGNANGDGTIKEGVQHAWVHNCAFYRPSDIANPAEYDKAQGDGAVDFKSGQYMTMSYNYFERNHKTSLIGSDDKCRQYHVTWHHNWWKDVHSRSPLCRQADVHIYNNLYESQTSYCMSLRANCYIFSEANTFRGCKNPVVDEGSGGVCKSYQDVFDNCNCEKPNAAKIVSDKTETVVSANPYANFESSATLGYSDHQLQTAAEAEATVRSEAGVQKKALDVTGYSAAAYGTLGDLNWFYTNEGDVLVPDAPAGATILAAGYESGNQCIKAAQVKNGTAALGAGVELGKLFRLGDNYAPQCPASGWGEAK